MRASRAGHIDTARVLLEAGAGLDVLHATGDRTALMLASANGHFEMVRLLLQSGARKSLRNQVSLHTQSTCYYRCSPPKLRMCLQANESAADLAYNPAMKALIECFRKLTLCGTSIRI